MKSGKTEAIPTRTSSMSQSAQCDEPLPPPGGGMAKVILLSAYPTEAINKGDGIGQVSAFYYEVENTLTVWFGNPGGKYVSEEMIEEGVLKKERSGKSIGFEKLRFSIAKPKCCQVDFETVVALRRRLYQAGGASSRSGCGPTHVCTALASPR